MRRDARYRSARTTSKARRRSTRLAVFMIVLVAAMVGADFAFAAVAEHAVSAQARERFDLADDPGVTIHGFPFTRQALRGHYDHITVSAEGVDVGTTLRELELVAELRDVRAPLRDVIDGNTAAIAIGDLEGVIKIKQEDLARLTKLPTLTVKPAAEEFVASGDEADEVPEEDLQKRAEDTGTYGTSAGIQLAAKTDIGGTVKEILVYALIELDEDAVRIVPQRLEFADDEGATVVPPPVRDLLLPRFEHRIEPGSLPFGVRPSGVAVENGAVIVYGKAENVTFAEGAG